MNAFTMLFSLIFIADIILAAAGAKEYRSEKAELLLHKNSYPMRSLMFIGYGFVRFFYKPNNTDNKIHRMYICRYRNAEKAEQKMRAFTAHIITLAAVLLSVFLMLSAVSFSKSHKPSEALIIAAVGVFGAAFSGLMKGNKTLGVILDLLKTDTTEAEIITAMCTRFDAPETVITEDVKKAITELRKIGALDE